MDCMDCGLLVLVTEGSTIESVLSGHLHKGCLFCFDNKKVKSYNMSCFSVK